MERYILLNTGHTFLLLSQQGKAWERGAGAQNGGLHLAKKAPRNVSHAPGRCRPGTWWWQGQEASECFTASYRLREPVNEAYLLPLGLATWERRHRSVPGESLPQTHRASTGPPVLSLCKETLVSSDQMLGQHKKTPLGRQLWGCVLCSLLLLDCCRGG